MTTKSIKRFLTLTNILMIVCMLLFAGLVWTVIKLYNKPESDTEQVNNALNVPMRNWLDDEGRTHGVKPAVDLSKDMAEVVHKRLYDSVCAALNIKAKQIEDMRAIGTRTTDVIVPDAIPAVQPDGKVACKISYSDEWFTMYGIVCSDKDSIRYAYVDSLHVTRYWERNKILGMRIGKKKHYIDAYSLNKNTVVKGLSGVDVTNESSDRFSLSGYAGYRSQYNFQAVNAGLEAEIHINKRLSVEFSGEYYLNGGELKPAVSGKAKFSLLKL